MGNMPFIDIRKNGLQAVFVLISIAFTTSIFASQLASTDSGIDWLQLNMGLFGGLALFLAGLDLLSEGLKKAAGETLRTVLGKLTVNRFAGAITGAFVTAVLNSSSVTTVLVVGFVTAGVMTLSQSVGVIMGANIGSTFTAQILAFNISAYALIPIAIGFFMMFTAKSENVKHMGMMIMGLGLVFYGMSLMSDGMKPLRSYEPFMEVLAKMENPLFGILAGAVFTGLVQSSAATVGIAIAMASEGLLTLPAGIALALGANIGTCVTALLAAIGKPTEAIRASVVHISFNILGVLIWLPFLGVLAEIAIQVSPVATGLEGKARLAAEVPRQVANANTMFNVINTLVFIGFANWFARMAEKLVPERELPKDVIIEPEFLDTSALKVPTVALENVRLEIAHMGEIVQQMFSDFSEAMLKRDRSKLEEVQRMDDQVDVLEAEILRYLGEIRKQSLTESESSNVALAMKVADGFESVGDVIETELVGIGYRVLDENIQASDTLRHLYSKLGDQLSAAIEAAVRAVREWDQRAADEVLTMKAEIDHLMNQALEIQSQALAEVGPEEIKTIRMEMTVLENLKRIHTYLKRIAREIVPQEVRV